MAMTRLSTSESDGKANLHQGAVGVGIDINTGQALKAVQHGRPVEKHPDTGKDLSTFFVQDWQVFLELAARCYEITELGYLGADIVLDRTKGPQILELNARPGLAIQQRWPEGVGEAKSAVRRRIATSCWRATTRLPRASRPRTSCESPRRPRRDFRR